MARFSSPTQLTGCVRLQGDSRLCVGAIGERWLDEPSGALASPYLAPETLVAALPTDANNWVFVGQHGSRFSAQSPLGPFKSVQRPSQKYAEFAVVSGHWYGLTVNGELWQGSWNDLVGARLILPEPILGFAISPAGKGLALGIPERTWISRKLGANWEPLEIGPFGATSVSVNERGDFGITALLPKPQFALEGITLRDRATALSQAPKLRYIPAVFAETQGFVEGRTARAGLDVIELRRIDETWHVGTGPIDKPFSFTRTTGLEDCSALHLSASAQSCLVICRNDNKKAGNQALSLRESDPRAQHFKRLSGTITGRFNDIQIAAVDSNHFIATGVCAPFASQRVVEPSINHRLFNSKNIADCVPKSPVSIELLPTTSQGEKAFTLKSVAAPGSQIVAPLIAVSRDGQLAAFVARSGTAKPWQLYFSTDSGKSFGARSIDTLPVTGAAPGPRAVPVADRRDTRVIKSLNFGEDRSLSLVLQDEDSPFVFNFDDRGSLVAATMAPAGVSRIDAVGSRILAVSLTERNVYESLDRGALFELVGHLPAAACLTWLSCQVSCTSSGCLIGERFTRVGWGGRGASSLDIAGNPETYELDLEPQTERVMFRTPLVCQSNTTKVPAAAGLTHAPLPEQLSLAETLWYSPWQDWDKGSAGLFRALRSRTLAEPSAAFAPILHAGQAGFATNFNDRGLVIMRSTQMPRVGQALGDLEVAWMSFQRPNWVHARFRDAEPMQAGDSYMLGAERARRLLPAQLSVSGEGVFVQAHADDEHQLGSYFVTTNGTKYVPRIPWPVERIHEQQLTKDHDAWQAYAFDETGAVLLRARSLPSAESKDSPWEFTAQTVANPHGSRWSIRDQVSPYWGGIRPILVLGTSARGRQLQSLTAHELTSGQRPLGPAVQLPLPASLNEPPPACGARDRRELTRVVVPLLPSAARAIGIQDSNNQTRWLVASHAVMYASQTRACVDTLWAETLPGTTAINAIVALDSLHQAWLFRTKRVRGEDKVEAQSIQCQYDGAAKPPPEFETRTQARWNLERLPLSD